MGLMSKYNKGNAFRDVDTEGMEYVALKDVYDEKNPDKVFKIKAVYINPKSKLGKSCVAVGEDVQYNLPNFEVETVEAMLTDDEVIKAIKAGKVGFTIRPYTNDWSKVDGNGEKLETPRTFYGIDWVDID